VVASGSVGVACAYQCDGHEGTGKYDCTDAAVTLGAHNGANAAVALAGSQHHRTDAALTMGTHNGTDAAVSLVVRETIPR